MANQESEDARIRRLVQLADATIPSDGSTPDNSSVASSDRDSLSKQDLEELNRIKRALTFLNDATQPQPSVFDSQAAAETKADLGEGTLPFTEPPDEMPNSVGRFQIVRLLGEGGFARVYLAEDPHLNRQVALKILKGTHFFSREVAQRFDREAKAAALLSHPNIVPVFEAGTVDSHGFLASAFCDGITLKAFLEKKASLSGQLAATMIATLADAIEHAHRRGVIHRDLKPSNILLESNVDESEDLAIASRLKITDFGLAKHQEDFGPLETAEGAIVGTPAYMSPEQARGDTSIDKATDIYSLGILLYKMLTGNVPIQGKSNIETLLAIRTTDPSPPRKQNHSIPRDLEAICMKCLQRDPTRRYASAHDLAVDLNRWLSGDPVTARRTTIAERTWKWCCRNKPVAISLVIVSAALILALVQWRNAVHENQRATLSGERAERHQEMTQSVIEEMVTNIAKSQDIPAQLRKRYTQRAVDLQVALLAEEPNDTEVILATARAYGRSVRLLYHLQEFELAKESAEQMEQVLEPILDVPEAKRLQIEATQLTSDALRALGETEAAIEKIETQESTSELTDLEIARNRFQVGMAKMSGANDLPEAIANFSEAIQIYENLDGDHGMPVDKARAYAFMGIAEFAQENTAAAKSALLEANQLLTPILDTHDRSEAVRSDHCRVQLKLAEVTWAQLKQIGLPVAEDHPLLQECRGYFAACEQGYWRMLELNPLRLSSFGLMAMGFEFELQLEKGMGNLERAEAVINKFSNMFDQIPADWPLHWEIGVVLCESKIRFVKLLIEQQNVTEARNQLNACLDQINTLLNRYPEKDGLLDCQREAENLQATLGAGEN